MEDILFALEPRGLVVVTIVFALLLLIAFLTLKERVLLQRLTPSAFNLVFGEDREGESHVRVRATHVNAEAIIRAMTIGTAGVVGALATRELLLSLLQALSPDQRDSLRKELEAQDEHARSRAD